MTFIVHSDTCTSRLHFLHTIEVKIVFNNLVSIVYTQYNLDTPVSYYTLAIAWVLWHVPSCNNAGVYLTSIILHARTSLAYSCIILPTYTIIGYPWPTYIRWRVAYHAPTSYSVSEELHLHSLILYSRSSICIHAACTGS